MTATLIFVAGLGTCLAVLALGIRIVQRRRSTASLEHLRASALGDHGTATRPGDEETHAPRRRPRLPRRLPTADLVHWSVRKADGQRGLTPTDDRLADPDIETLDEEPQTDVPDEERSVPDDGDEPAPWDEHVERDPNHHRDQ